MTFEGFGTSLCWWTNIKYSEEIKNEIIELLNYYLVKLDYK